MDSDRIIIRKIHWWQHHGNKKSDSPYYLNNEKNTNTLS